MKRKIMNSILDFIREKYGEREMLCPCYDIEEMTDYILEELGEDE